MSGKTLLLVLVGALTSGCGAKLAQLPMPPAEDRAEVLIYRQTSTLGRMQPGAAIFGMNEIDVVMLLDREYAQVFLLPSDYRFFVRSESDKPFIVPLGLEKGKRKCLRTYDNPTNLGKAFIPLAYLLTSLYVLEEVTCPTEEEMMKLKRKAVGYKPA